MVTSPPALEVQNVTKTFKIHHERATSLKQFVAMGGRNRYQTFYALRDVSFDVAEGEAVGIIGHNGSGKSTMLKCMAGILRPNGGTIVARKRMAALLELGAGFTPELSGSENVYLNAAILGMSRRDIARRFDDIVEFSGLENFIDTPVMNYSSGMYVRLAFAVAINVDPEMLLIDEILAVGDVTFQQKCMEKFVEFRQDGRTLVLVTHDLTNVRNFCDRAIWIDQGQIRGQGDPADLVDEYTESMLGGEGEGGSEQGLEPLRRGPGEIRVESAEFIVDGQRSRHCRTGEEVVLRLHWTAAAPVRTPVFSVKIASLGGAVVSAPSTKDVGAIPDTLQGSGTVELRIPDLPFLPGAYLVHTEVTGFARQRLFDHLQNAVRFDVLPGRTNETEGLVTLSPEWTV